jgi:signal transduction histidine kinase
MYAGEMQLTSRFFVRFTTALLFVGFLALLVIVGMTIWLAERAQIHFDEALGARDARQSAVELRNAVLSAESSQRGFLVTGNEIYLAPYGTAKAQSERQLAALNRSFAPHPDSAVPVERLTAIIAEKFAEMDETIALKRDRRDAEALAIIRTNRGKTLMDEANVFFAGLIRAADDRLTAGVGEQRENATWLRWISTLAGTLIVAVVGGAATAVIRYTRELAEARDEVAALNAGLEERVKDRTANLARANDEIQRFAYIVTHDLRAPLVNIMGFTSELEASVNVLQALIERSGAGASADPAAEAARIAATEDLPEAIGFIRSSTKKMDALINTILKLSREGRRTLRPECVDLGEVIRTSAAAIQHQIAEANGTINVELDVPPMLQDKLSLEQIFGNLFDNAVKYRSKDRPLRIGVRAGVAPGDRIAIEIADNGRGIADQDRERVFELFRRSGVQDQPGEGIGLAYVRTVIRNLGGDITLTSHLDLGTTFRVVLPRTVQFPESSVT